MGFLKIDQLDEFYLIGIFLALVYCFLNYKLLSLRDDLHYFSWRRKTLNYYYRGKLLNEATQNIELLKQKRNQQYQTIRTLKAQISKLESGGQ